MPSLSKLAQSLKSQQILPENDVATALMDFVYSNLYGADRVDYSPEKFGTELLLCSISIGSDYNTDGSDNISDILEGNALVKKSGFSYSDLFQAIKKISNHSDAHFFYIRNPDNCLSLLDYIGKCDFTHSSHDILRLFEMVPAAQGGNNYLLLLSENKDWLVDFQYIPGNDFLIFARGDPSFTDCLLEELTS